MRSCPKKIAFTRRFPEHRRYGSPERRLSREMMADALCAKSRRNTIDVQPAKHLPRDTDIDCAAIRAIRCFSAATDQLNA